VAAHDEVVAQGGQLGDRVGRVHHGQSERPRFRANSGAKVVPLDVGIIEPDDFQPDARYVDRFPAVPEMDPSIGFQQGNELSSPAGNHPAPTATLAEIRQIAQRSRGEVIIGAEDEVGGGSPANRPERCGYGLDGFRFPEHVPGHHGHVRRGKRGQQVCLPRIGRDEMQVRDVQEREARQGLGREDGQPVHGHSIPAPFDQDAVCDARSADNGHSEH